MASAFHDSHGWIADFRPPAVTGRKRRRVRIRPDQLAPGDEAAAAHNFAQELERYSRLLDGFPTADQLAHAAQIGAVTPEEAAALRQGQPLPLPRDPSRLTLLQANDDHPSTKREAKNAPAEYDRHTEALKEFVAWSAVAYVDEIRLSLIQRYLDYLRGPLGLKYDSRRHRLLPIRRACAIGAGEHGLPDPLSGFVLDRNDEPAPVEIWTPQELCQAVLYLQTHDDKRSLAALALGGFLGLRPSEMIRARVGDIVGDVVGVGKVIAKNPQSRRWLPIPKVAQAWLKAWCEGLEPTSPILVPDRKRRGRDELAEYGHHELAHWMGPVLAAATGRALDTKCLRKSFATWAIAEGVNPNLVDEYLGHKVASVSAVTARHYLAATRLKELQAVAKAIDKSAGRILQQLSTKGAKR